MDMAFIWAIIILKCPKYNCHIVIKAAGGRETPDNSGKNGPQRGFGISVCNILTFQTNNATIISETPAEVTPPLKLLENQLLGFSSIPLYFSLRGSRKSQASQSHFIEIHCSLPIYEPCT